MKIRFIESRVVPSGRTDGRKDRRIYMMKLIFIFRNFANELKQHLIICKKKIQTRHLITLEISRTLLSVYNIRAYTKTQMYVGP
jgi:hypothetical protein